MSLKALLEPLVAYQAVRYAGSIQDQWTEEDGSTTWPPCIGAVGEIVDAVVWLL